MRILYVATTRAKERLILTACEKAKHCRNIIRNGFYLGTGPIPDWQLRPCRSALEWFLYALSDQKTLHKAFETSLAGKTVNDDLFSFKLYNQPELRSLSEYILKLKTAKSKRPAATAKSFRAKRKETELLGRIKKSLSWRYPFSDVALLPAKRSVTQLTHHADEFVKFDYSKALEQKPKAVSPHDLIEPRRRPPHRHRRTSSDFKTRFEKTHNHRGNRPAQSAAHSRPRHRQSGCRTYRPAIDNEIL